MFKYGRHIGTKAEGQQIGHGMVEAISSKSQGKKAGSGYGIF